MFIYAFIQDTTSCVRILLLFHISLVPYLYSKPKENIIFFSVQHARARSHAQQDTNERILTLTVMMMGFRLNYLDGPLVQCLSFYYGH